MFRYLIAFVLGIPALGIGAHPGHATGMISPHESTVQHLDLDDWVAEAMHLQEARRVASLTPATLAPRRPAVGEAAPGRPEDRRYVSLFIGGDLGFGGSALPVHPKSGTRHGRRYRFSELTEGIRPLLTTDLAFANLETVVTASNSLGAYDKTFTFRMHPNGVAHLVDAGFNVLSTANNHAIDYGRHGMRDTLRHLGNLPESAGLMAVHGIAATRQDLLRPARFTIKGARFAFAAAGIGGIRATANSPGQVSPSSTSDFPNLLTALTSEAADYRMLSLHYGAELQVRPSRHDREALAGYASSPDAADLVIGHHAHTPAGIARVGNRLVFYGLGNLLHLGMQDMARYSRCRDFGLAARLHLTSERDDGGRLVARAIEIFALRDMHLKAKPRTGEDGRRRIDVINYHAEDLTDAEQDRVGLRFMARPDGSGLYCALGAARQHPALAKLCAGWNPPPPLDTAARRSLDGACRYLRKNMIVKSTRPGATPTRSARSKRRLRFRRTVFQPRD